MGRSAVLSTKPVVEALDGLPSKWVRMGHLHVNGKICAEHFAIVEDRVRSNLDSDLFQGILPISLPGKTKLLQSFD